jgi:hypothetical protein
LKDPRFDVLAVVNIKDYDLLGCVSPTLKMEAMESIYSIAWHHTPGA